MQKSTKEIARQAVEAEFQRAGKRRKRNVDSSDDEDDKKKKGRHQQSETFREPNRRSSSSELERLAANYRDRVKERREGVSAEDVATLRFSVEDQLFNDAVTALESGNRQKLARMARPDDGILFPTTFEEAIAFISEPDSRPPHAKLGIDVLAYLRKAHLAVGSDAIRVSSAGRSVQHSVWTFTKAINADPRDRARSWEFPWEQTFAATNFTSHSDSDENIIDKSCVCSTELLSQMLDFYAKHGKKQEHRGYPDVLPTLKVPGISLEHDDDDDDIFENVGKYNVAARREDVRPNESQSKNIPSKGSVFGPHADERKNHDPLVTLVQADGPLATVPATRKLSSLVPLKHDDDVELYFGGQDYDDDDYDNNKKGRLGNNKKDEVASKLKMKSNKKKGTQSHI